MVGSLTRYLPNYHTVVRVTHNGIMGDVELAEPPILAQSLAQRDGTAVCERTEAVQTQSPS